MTPFYNSLYRRTIFRPLSPKLYVFHMQWGNRTKVDRFKSAYDWGVGELNTIIIPLE